MASKKEYTMLFALNASLNGGFNTTFAKASSAVAGMQKELMALAKEQSDISAYEKQQKGIEATERKLEVLRQQYDNIQKEIEQTEGFSSSLENKLLSKQQQIDKTSASLENQTQKLEQMGNALEEAGIDTASLTSESQRLENEMRDLRERQEEAAETAEEYGTTASQAFSAVSNALVAAGIAEALKKIAEAYGECIKLSADFDSAMSQVAATMGRSNADMGTLSEFAKKMGAETKFTALEAADGMNILAMAGLNEQQIISGLPTVLNLASAGAMDMAQAAAYTTGAVKGFSDTMDNARYYADLMAKGATMANTNVQQLGEALGESAATAASYGQSADSVTLSLLRLAEQNIVGSEAATKLNRAMADIYTPTAEAKEVFEELKLEMYDESGVARDFNECIDDINAALQGYTQEQQNAYKNTIFTTNGLKAFNMMTVSGAEKVDQFWNGLRNASGSAGKQAETQIDNLNGSLTIMNSAWDGLRITLGEEFSGELRGLVDLGTDLLTGVNAFVKANPGLVKGVLTTTGALAGATTAIIGVSAGIKAVTAASAALSLAVPGIGTILGVTAAVAALAGGVVALSTDMNANIPSMKELTSAASGLTEELKDADKAFADTMAEARATADVTDMYIGKLEELQDAGVKTEEQQREYNNVCELLKQTMPELSEIIDANAKSYDIDTEALRNNTKAFLENAEAQAREEYLAGVRSKYNDVLKEQYINEIKLSEAKIKAENASKKSQEAQEALNAMYTKARQEENEYFNSTGMVIDATLQYKDEIDALIMEIQTYDEETYNAIRAQEKIEKAIAKDADAVAEAEAAMNNADEAIKAMSGDTEQAAETTADYSGVIALLGADLENVYSKLDQLRDKYGEAYEAARTSLEGQYALWDEVAKVSEISTASITEKLGQQTAYWKDYNDNLASLRERSGEIEGLAEVIGSFADGSEESVNAIAGMSSASDEDLKAMVENYKALRDAQDETATNIASMATNFDAETQKIADSTKAMVEDMNLEKEAASAARETIQAYIDMASEMTGQVGTAYGNVAKAAMAGLNGGSAKAPQTAAYAEGTDNAPPGLALVGEKGPELVMMQGGEKVVPANETARMLTPPDPASGSSNTVTVQFNISGSASEDIIKTLDQYGEEFAERVLSVIQDAETDRKRRSYT